MFPLSFLLQFGQIIDIRAMLNDVTRLNIEEGASGEVKAIFFKRMSWFVFL